MAQPSEKQPEGPGDPLLHMLGARRPTRDEIAALRRMVRQNMLAANYLLGELCSVGKVGFCGENTHATSFRSGSQGVGIMLAMIAGVPVMQISREELEAERAEMDGERNDD